MLLAAPVRRDGRPPARPAAGPRTGRGQRGAVPAEVRRPARGDARRARCRWPTARGWPAIWTPRTGCWSARWPAITRCSATSTRSPWPRPPTWPAWCARHGRYAEARTIDAEALSGLRRSVGADHPFTLSCANGLAADLRHTGEAQQAREIAADTLVRSRAVRGARPPGHRGLRLERGPGRRRRDRSAAGDGRADQGVRRRPSGARRGGAWRAAGDRHRPAAALTSLGREARLPRGPRTGGPAGR